MSEELENLVSPPTSSTGSQSTPPAHLVMQIVYAICVVVVLVFIGQLDHVAFPYWFEHGLVASIITSIPALVGVGLFAYNWITICTLNTFVGIAIIAGAAFYVGREVRDHEKLGGEFDYKGLCAPLVAEVLIAAGYVLFAKRYINLVGKNAKAPILVYLGFLAAFAWLTGLIASKWHILTSPSWANEYEESLPVYKLTLALLSVMMLFMIRGLVRHRSSS